MSRKMIKINEEKCIGCGLCVSACKESVIDIVNGKAKIIRDDYCDGLGNCLPVCPTRAITFEEQAESLSIKPKNSNLNQWPVQIKLVQSDATFFQDTKLLIAADCTAYAYKDFHNKIKKNKITIIGCPKLDNVDYIEKLTEIISNNKIHSITIARMDVPCCAGIVNATKLAIQNSKRIIPWKIVTITTDGKLL